MKFKLDRVVRMTAIHQVAATTRRKEKPTLSGACGRGSHCGCQQSAISHRKRSLHLITCKEFNLNFKNFVYYVVINTPWHILDLI